MLLRDCKKCSCSKRSYTSQENQSQEISQEDSSRMQLIVKIQNYSRSSCNNKHLYIISTRSLFSALETNAKYVSAPFRGIS
mmetsp:Transcript_10092/g.12438  ORF Transcript_10092/g.12438 Transcript_10092/m.12438 type:complete len:81 (+) Transcript_10092:550-792(+)